MRLKRFLLFVFLALPLLACNLFAGNDAAPTAIPSTTSPTIQPTAMPTTNQDQRPEFKDFPATKLFQSVPAQVNFNSFPDAATYKTQLSQQAAKGPNFAGHFTVVEIGCGSNCQAHVIVDAENGNVYGGIATERGIGINLNSNLYIADPPYAAGTNAYADDPTATLPARYYVWDGTTLKLVYQETCTVAGKQQVCGKGK